MQREKHFRNKGLEKYMILKNQNENKRIVFLW